MGRELIGRAFLTFKPGRTKSLVCWQGEIVGVEGDAAIAELYEWVLGEQSNTGRIPLSEFEVSETENGAFIKMFDDYRARNEFYENWRKRNPVEI